jgi:hypothetical protein
MELYPLVLSFIKEIAPTWRKTEMSGLALLTQAIFRRRSLVLTELARAYPIPQQRKVDRPKHGLLHRVKRVWRFVHSSVQWDESALMKRLTILSCSVCRTPGLLLPILVDLTYFDPYAVLSANIPSGGRALPIAWRTFRRDLEGEGELSQNLIIRGVLRAMLDRLAKGIEAVIVADREFASADFFRFLKGQHTRFAIRVDAETWILHPNYTGAMGGIGLKPGGRRIWLTGALYGKEEREPVNLLVLWEVGFKEPWLIASDLEDPKLVERLYRKRMKIEHGYRDWKHHLRLKGTAKVKSAQHLAGLITAVVVLYWYLCLLGIRSARSHLQGELRSWGSLGDFKAGMELLALGPQLFSPICCRLLRWLTDKLWPYAPPTPTYKLRYRYNRLIP